jgi:hypothetical protein
VGLSLSGRGLSMRQKQGFTVGSPADIALAMTGWLDGPERGLRARPAPAA